MAWITPDPVKVKASLVAPYELRVLQAQQNSTQVLTDTIARVVLDVQGACRAGKYLPGGVIPAGFEGMIPDELYNVFIDLTRWLYLEQFPNLKTMQTDVRMKAYLRADDRLNKVRQHEYAIESPVPTGNQGSPGAAYTTELIPGRM